MAIAPHVIRPLGFEHSRARARAPKKLISSTQSTRLRLSSPSR